MYNSAIQATKGDFSFAQDDYYTSWVYQLGFTMYQAFIIKLFGEGPFLLTFKYHVLHRNNMASLQNNFICF